MARNIVITGVSRGLGRALTHGFIRDGHTVYGCATNADAIDSLKRQFGAAHQFNVVDVAHADQVQRWASSVLEVCPCPDLVVNNAAVINRSEPLCEIHPREFEAVFQVNVCGVFHVIRSFVPAMEKHHRGVLVNFSSGWGRSTSPEVVPYCASKFAVEGLSRGLSQELSRGVACVALNPGIIHTDMLESCFGESAAAFPRAEEWAERAVPFLLALDVSDNGRSVDVPS